MTNWSTKHDDAINGVTITSKQADRIFFAGKQVGFDARTVLELARLTLDRPDLRCIMDLTAIDAEKVVQMIGAIEC
jgi:hypothetical protein